MTGEPKHADVLRALGVLPQEAQRDEPTPRRPSGFDGGARRPVSPPSDPLRDHDELLVEIIGSTPRTGHSQGW